MALAPHRPARAQLTHAVLHSTASLSSSIAMDDPGRGQRISIHQPQELLPSDVALPRASRQPFPPKPPRLKDNSGEALIVAADAEVGKVPLEHPAESAMLLGHRRAVSLGR